MVDLEDLLKQFAELKQTGVIHELQRPYAFPIEVVTKKNGFLRRCIDYRTLNWRTISDQYTTPQKDDALKCLSRVKLELKSIYYQIPMHHEKIKKTASARRILLLSMS